MRHHVAAGIFACITIALAVSHAGAPGQAQESLNYDPADRARAEEMLTQARNAIGGEAMLKGVMSFSASIGLRRIVEYISVKSPKDALRRNKVLKGKISIECQFPDKFRKHVSTSTLSGFKYSFAETVDGDLAWRDPPLQPPTSGRDPRLIDVSDFEKSLAYQAQGARQQLSFYALALLVRAVPGAPLKFSRTGWTQTESGKADVVMADGLTDYHVWLLLDQKTHLLLGFDSSYTAVRRIPVLVETMTLTFRGQYLLAEKARQERAAQSRQPQVSRIQMRFSDHRRVAGVLLPQRLTTAINGKLVEEMLVEKYEINPRLNPKTFEPKPQEKSRAR